MHMFYIVYIIMYICIMYVCIHRRGKRERVLTKTRVHHLFCTFLRTYGKNLSSYTINWAIKISLSKFQRYRILATQALLLIANAIKLEFNNKGRTQRPSGTRYTKEYWAESHILKEIQRGNEGVLRAQWCVYLSVVLRIQHEPLALWLALCPRGFHAQAGSGMESLGWF